MNIKIQTLFFMLMMITTIYGSRDVTASREVIGPDENDFKQAIQYNDPSPLFGYWLYNNNITDETDCQNMCSKLNSCAGYFLKDPNKAKKILKVLRLNGEFKCRIFPQTNLSIEHMRKEMKIQKLYNEKNWKTSKIQRKTLCRRKDIAVQRVEQEEYEEFMKPLTKVHKDLDSYKWQLEHSSQEWQQMDFTTLQKNFSEKYKRQDFNMTEEVYEDFRNYMLEHRIKTIFKKIKELGIQNQKTLIFDVRYHKYNVAKFYDFLMECIDDYDNVESMEISADGYSTIEMHNSSNKISIMNSNAFQDTDMTTLSNMVNKMPNLQSLSLHNNNITAAGFDHLLSNLQIPELIIWRNDIHGISQVNNQTVNKLALKNAKLTDTDAKILSKMNLTNLNVRRNNVTFEGFIDIFQISGMKKLDISGNSLDQNINDENLKELTEMLNFSENTEFQHLEQLKLDDNKLGKYSAALITILHQKYKYLKNVSFFRCDIDDETAVKIVESFLKLPKTDKIIDVSLAYNKITTKGFTEILELLKKYEDRNHLVHLDLEENGTCAAKKQDTASARTNATEYCGNQKDKWDCKREKDCTWIELSVERKVERQKNWIVKL